MSFRLISVAVPVALLLGLGGIDTGAAHAGVHAAPSAAASPRAAVLQLIRPYYDRSAQHAACNGVEGKLAACPLTSRLRASLARELQWERKHPSGGNGNAFCRCQNPPRQVTITAVTTHGATATVNTTWSWGAGPKVHLTFVTVRAGGGWLVDNEYCTARPVKDMYHIPIGPCS